MARARGREDLAEIIASTNRYEAGLLVVDALGLVMLRMMQNLDVVVGSDPSLEQADIEVLERAYIAIGAELDRRKAP